MKTCPQSQTLQLTAFFAAWVIFAPILSAQFGTEFVAEQDIGRPPQPPFISFLGIVSPGKMATDPSLPPKGPVAEAFFEELRAVTSPGGPAGEVISSIKTKYDEQGRVLEEIRTEHGAELDTTYGYQGTRLVSQETTFPNSKSPRPKSWNYWTYNPSGRLTEYKRGSGDKIQNHVVNFNRDQEGRLTSYDYRQGEKDELFERTEIRYLPDGKTIDISSSDRTGEVMRSMTEVIDDQGHVVQVVIREQDWRTKKLKRPLKVTFSYDNKGRLVEQNADPHDFEPGGSEHELPPGKVAIAYDDVRHTRKTAYSGKEGSISSTITYNSTGSTMGVAVETAGESFEAKLECTYDDHENWTTCQRIARKAGASTVSNMWRRKMTYR